MKPRILFLCFVILSQVALSQIKRADQIIVAVAPTWSSTSGTMYLFERGSDGWIQYNVPWQVMMGDSGLAWGIGLHTNPKEGREKAEGDHCSPAGVFELGDFFGYDSLPPAAVRFPYRQATKDLHCVDDTASVFYNSYIEGSNVVRDTAGRLPWSSSEVMKLDSADYKLGIFVLHNPRNVPGKGSCVFLHLNSSTKAPTVGCTAMDEDHMIFLMQWLDPAKHPVLVQLPLKEFNEYLLDWGLPLLSKN